MRNPIFLFVAASLLVGCASGPDWTRRVYSFSLAPDPPSTNSLENTVAISRVAISPLFQNRSFTYRIAEHSYEQDPYAGFLISPERALGESIRASLRAGGVFGRIVEPASGLIPNVVIEVFINELYGDFRNRAQPVGKMEIHFLCYEVKDSTPGRVVLDGLYARETPLKEKSPAALMAAWDADLGSIMEQVQSEYTRGNSSHH
jgi:hypothetical protein